MGDVSVNYALAQPYASQSSYFGMNNQFDLFGKMVNLKGSTYRSFPKIQDEPVKVKLKPKVTMKSLWGKIAVGLAVVACVACVAAYGASLVFTGGASAVLAPAIVGGLAAFVGGQQVLNKAHEDIENQSESSWFSYIWTGAKGAYTGAEIGFALVTVGQLAYGFLAALSAGGGGAAFALAGAGGGTMSFALEGAVAGVTEGAIAVVVEGAIGLGIVSLMESAATGSGGGTNKGSSDTEVEWPSKPHTNGTKGHWETIQNKVNELVESGEYESIYVNKGLSNEVPGASPNRRPDIMAVKKDGTIDQFEVPSKTDTARGLYDRMMDNKRIIGNRAGKIEVVPIRKE